MGLNSIDHISTLFMNKKETIIEPQKNKLDNFSRRRFLGLTGGLLAAGVMLDSCSKDDNSGSTGVVLTKNDIGVLNYAYALEQMEAAFYTELTKRGFYPEITADEKLRLSEIHNHDTAHRELLKALTGTKAIPTLSFDFSSVNFTGRDSVLQAARTLKDLSVSAYNGAARLVESAQYVLLIAKIASVEARHSAYIRELLKTNSFSSAYGTLDYQFDAFNGMENSKSPDVVLAAASTYIKTPIVNNLPLS